MIVHYNAFHPFRIWDIDSCRTVIDLPPHPTAICSLLLLPLPPPPVYSSSYPPVLLVSADASSNVNIWLLYPGAISSPPPPSAALLCSCQLQPPVPQFDAELVAVTVAGHARA